MTHLDDLTLPGKIPALRSGSPIVLPDGRRAILGGFQQLRSGTRRAVGVWVDSEGGAGMPSVDDATRLRLDLTDATGRAHAAWALATRFKHLCETPHGPTGAVWRRQRWSWPVWGLTGPAPSMDYPGTERTGPVTTFGSWPTAPEQNAWFESARTEGWFRIVPGLDDLDPNDPRLLPDGYRWVDAKALQVTCLHEFGSLSAG